MNTEYVTPIGWKQVEQQTKMCRKTVRRLVEDRLFVRPVYQSPTTVEFDETDVRIVAAARVAGLYEHEIRYLVLVLNEYRENLTSSVSAGIMHRHRMKR